MKVTEGKEEMSGGEKENIGKGKMKPIDRKTHVEEEEFVERGEEEMKVIEEKEEMSGGEKKNMGRGEKMKAQREDMKERERKTSKGERQRR